MPVRPSEIAGNQLTEQDKEYLRDWLNWIDNELVKFRYEQKKPDIDGSFKVRLSAKIPLSKQIIDALLVLYKRNGWVVEYTLQESSKGKFRSRYLIFAAPDLVQIEEMELAETAKFKTHKSIKNEKVGYVYLVKGENGLYKIGRSKTPDIRIRNITKTIAPFDIQIIHTAFYPDCYKAESDLHKLFKDKRRRGEWFELTDEEVMKVIAHAYTAT